MNLEENTKKEAGEEKNQFGMLMLRSRAILLCGEIDKKLAEQTVRQLIVMDQQGSAPIKVYIDSPGGDADAGFAIFDMIRFVKAPVCTIGMGLVASAGALVLLAAPPQLRMGLPNSHYLIHQPLSGMRGVASDIEIHAREIEKMRTRLNRLISKETKKSIKAVQKDTDRDFWMDAEEAVDYGLIAHIITREADFRKVMNPDTGGSKSTPKSTPKKPSKAK